MKILKPILLATVASVSYSAQADVIFHFDSYVDVLIVNGEKPKVEGKGLFSSDKTITLPDGENQIAFKYAYAFDKKDEREFVETDVIIAKFDASNTDIAIKAQSFRNEREAQKNISDFKWELIDQNSNQAIPVKQDKLLHEGFQLSRNYAFEVSEYNQTGGIAAVGQQSVATEHKEIVAFVPAKNGKADAYENRAESMLHFWYEQADAETKARFKAFIENN